MPDPLATTFALLTSTRNKSAVDLMIAALDVDVPRVKSAAVTGLLTRSSARGQIEVIRRFHTLSAELRSQLKPDTPSMQTAIRQSLLHGEHQLRANGLEVIRVTEAFDQLPLLLTLLENEHDDLNEQTTQTLRDLVSRLYDRKRNGQTADNRQTPSRPIAETAANVIATLQAACSRFYELSQPVDVIESILILGEVDDEAVKNVLWQSIPDCRELAGELLLLSRHPGVMQLVCDSMSKNYPHPKAFAAIGTRSDPEFICHLLRWFPTRPSRIQRGTFQQVESIDWLKPATLLDSVPAGLQTSLVNFIASTGLPNELKSELGEQLVKHGAQAGRCAATDVLLPLHEREMREIIWQSLDDEDPGTQAWATSQLRAHRIPEAFSLLIERLDSPLPEVRDAARGELADFNLDRMLSLYDHIEPHVAARAAMLMRKVDPEFMNKLRRELSNPSQRRRIRAAEAALAMDVQTEVVSALLVMLQDKDAMVRRVAVEVLGTVPTGQSIDALSELIEDSSPRVRGAVEDSLNLIHHAEPHG